MPFTDPARPLEDDDIHRSAQAMRNKVTRYRRRRKGGVPSFAIWLGGAVMVALASAAGWAYFDTLRPSHPQVIAAQPAVYSRCSASRYNCVVDGDTLWISGEKVRIADIDTPEISQPKCAAEKALGERATLRLIELINVGQFEVRAFGARDVDQYGRKLRILIRDGHSLGDILVKEGLARTWTGRRQPWC